MFQFPGFPLIELCIHSIVTGLHPAGFPHSDIKGSMPACGSPLLFAACHVLPRRLVPWHPPCALVRLITLLRLLQSFRSNLTFFLQLVFLDFFSRLPSVQLSRCAGDLSPLRLPFRILKTIQSIERQFLLWTFPAFRLHVLPLTSGLPAFRLSAFTDFSAIDLGLKPPISLRLAP